jgi:hypothetical protein
VLVETLALLQHRFGPVVDDFQDAVLPLLTTVWVDAELHAEGVAGLLRARRRGLSVVDGVSFACMRR